jgi:primosomal protein N'
MESQLEEETTSSKSATEDFYCPHCGKEVKEPLACGDCGSLICRDCGTPLERTDELGMG